MPDHQNQHFVPAGYLRNFATDSSRSKSLLWAYDKERAEIYKKPVSVHRICSRPGYYEVPAKQGGLDQNSVERHLQTIEDRALRIIRKVRRHKLTDELRLPVNGRADLALFLGMLLVRNPAFRDGIHEMHQHVVRSTIDNLERQGELRDLSEALEQDKMNLPLCEILDVQIKTWVSIVPMLNSAVTIAESIMRKNWVFVFPAKEQFFLTSDNPVSIGLPHLVAKQLRCMPFGPAHPVSELSVPLARDLGVVCTPRFAIGSFPLTLPDGTMKKLDAAETIGYNGRSIASASRYVYASWKSSETLDYVKKLRNESQKLVAS